MGVVYKARQIRLNRLCALKITLPGEHTGAEFRARFLAEAETIARLRHPNLVQIYGLGEHEGRPYFEMEYIEGGSLARRLDGTPWSPEPAARLVAVLARAIGDEAPKINDGLEQAVQNTAPLGALRTTIEHATIIIGGLQRGRARLGG